MKLKKQQALTDRLVKNSVKAGKKAYAPYSKLHVGASLITAKGNVYSGCNVENSSFGLTSCAERNAIFAAISEEGPGMTIVAIAVTADSPLAISPCGACRQVIAEFRNRGKEGTTVTFKSKEGMVSRKIETLLTDSFEMQK
jgi:cytidine deaminase